MEKTIVIKELLNAHGEEDLKLVIYGAGMKGQKIAGHLTGLGVKIDYFCDKSEEKIGTSILDIPCISIEELKNHENISVIIGIIDEVVKEEVRKELVSLGVKKFIQESIFAVIDFLPNEPEYTPHVPLGHFYSPFPNVKEIVEKKGEIYEKRNNLENYLDISLNVENQIQLIEKISGFYDDMQLWKNNKEDPDIDCKKMRYYCNNYTFLYQDAYSLHGMLRIFQPKKIIEVGSGYSSAMTLDTNEYFLNHSMELTFIEPYPNRLKSILKPTDHINLIEEDLQNVSYELFEQLESGDFVFFDSTHVSKINSDVNYIFFEILPRLKSGLTLAPC